MHLNIAEEVMGPASGVPLVQQIQVGLGRLRAETRKFRLSQYLLPWSSVFSLASDYGVMARCCLDSNWPRLKNTV